jgi:hypothetical protein
MHVELEVHSGADALCGSFVMSFKTLAGGLADQLERAGTSKRVLTLKDLGSFSQPTGAAGVGSVQLSLDRPAVDNLAALREPCDIRYRVMHNRGVAGTQLDRFNPAILFERNCNVEILHWQFTLGRDLELDRHWYDQVGLTPAPAPGELRQSRKVRIVALRRAAINPGNYGVDLLLGKPPVVAELEGRRGVRVPGRHTPFGHLLTNRFRPRAHLLKRGK